MKKTKNKKVWKPDGYIKSHLRKIWRWSPQRRETLRSKSCIQCGKKGQKLFADHITPVVDPSKGFQDWNVYIDRLFNGKLQPLCAECHNKKTKEESTLRRKFRKERASHEKASD